MALPRSMKAIKTGPKGVAEVVSNAPLPCSVDSIPDTYLLVKTTYVALNPTDWKHVDFADAPNHTVGCDLSGTVVAIGQGVTKPFAVGDRVAGFSHGVKIGVPTMGAFGEYALLKGDVALRVPANVTDAEACTVGIGITTVGQGLYQTLQLPFPDGSDHHESKIPLLVYGGSTATGLFAIQLAKLSGFKVITTCSPRNFAKVRAFGADEVFDYSDPSTCARAISDAAGKSLMYAFDTITTEESVQICADALSKDTSLSKRPSCATLAPIKFPRDDVEVNYSMAYTVIGETFDSWRGIHMPADAEDFAAGKRLWTAFEAFLADGKIKLFPSEQQGGFEGVLQGLDLLRNDKVSGEKLVYKIG